jgi:hypothetical protein
MAVVSMSGDDTIILNNRVLKDFGDGDVIKVTFETDIANVKTGKNGNSIFGLNTTGQQATVELRLIRGASDDVFLNSLQAQQTNNFSGFALIYGQFIKKIGNGAGKIAKDTYILQGGVFVRPVDGVSNVEGNTDQSQSIYRLKFSGATRTVT